MIKEYAFPATFVRSLIHFRSLRVTKGARVIAPLYTPLGFTTTHINSHQLTIIHCNCLHFLHFLPLSPTFSTFRRATLGVDSKVTVPNSWGTPHRDLVVLNAHLEVLSVASRCHGKMEKWKNGKMTSVDENPILTDLMFTDVHPDGIKTGIGWLGARTQVFHFWHQSNVPQWIKSCSLKLHPAPFEDVNQALSDPFVSQNQQHILLSRELRSVLFCLRNPLTGPTFCTLC